MGTDLWQRLRVGCSTDVGLKRDKNEDTYRVPRGYAAPEEYSYGPPGDDEVAQVGLLFLVADGMGGHEAGEVASAEAARAFAEAYYSDGGTDPLTAMGQSMGAADEAVRERARELGVLDNAGTTLSAVAIRGDGMVWGHVGDSRIYLLRDAFDAGDEEPADPRLMVGQGPGIRLLTEDHTEVMEWLKMRRITAGHAREARHGVLTQVVGMGDEMEPEVGERELLPGDRVLLCSDGLHGMVREPQELASISRGHPDPQQACEALVAAAIAAGGEDNVTVMLIEVGGGAGNVDSTG